jgi:hypothetical protein
MHFLVKGFLLGLIVVPILFIISILAQVLDLRD